MGEVMRLDLDTVIAEERAGVEKRILETEGSGYDITQYISCGRLVLLLDALQRLVKMRAEVAEAWADYNRGEISEEEWEGTIAERFEQADYYETHWAPLTPPEGE